MTSQSEQTAEVQSDRHGAESLLAQLESVDYQSAQSLVVGGTRVLPTSVCFLEYLLRSRGDLH